MLNYRLRLLKCDVKRDIVDFSTLAHGGTARNQKIRAKIIMLEWNHIRKQAFCLLEQCFSTLVLEAHCPAHFSVFPAPNTPDPTNQLINSALLS